jgi:hypothetical protein
MRFTLFTLLIASWAVVAHADESISDRPGDCQLVSIIQFDECWMQKNLTCGKGENTLYRTERLQEGSPTIVEHRTPNLRFAGLATEGNPIEFLGPKRLLVASGQVERLVVKSENYELALRFRLFGVEKPVTLRVEQRVEDKPAQIDGVVLIEVVQKTELVFPPPMPVVKGESRLMISEDFGFYYTASGLSDLPGLEEPIENSVVEFVLPSEEPSEEMQPTENCLQLGNLNDQLNEVL